MAKGFKHGAGGVGLNFKVIGNPIPEIARENTIWLDTDNKITGWFFSSKEPAQPTEGFAWIEGGIDSATKFNALKKNGIQVCPLSAKQYVSGAWVDVEAMSYQDGKWVDWAIYVYNHGFNNLEMIGEWVPRGCVIETTGSATAPDLVFSEKEMQIYLTSSANYPTGMVYSKNKVDLTPYKEIRLVAKNPGNRVQAYFYAWKSIPSNANSNYAAYKTLGILEDFTEFVIDVSNVDQSCYLGFAMMFANHTISVQTIELIRK